QGPPSTRLNRVPWPLLRLLRIRSPGLSLRSDGDFQPQEVRQLLQALETQTRLPLHQLPELSLVDAGGRVHGLARPDARLDALPHPLQELAHDPPLTWLLVKYSVCLF